MLGISILIALSIVQNPTFPAGLNGLSTGSTAQFTALGTAPTPNIPRPANTLTGEALSAFEASIATNAAQASGSDFMYTSTTGNQISGVAATLSGGYNEQAPGQSSMASVSSSTQSTSSNDGGFTMRVLGSERQSLLAGISLLLTAFLFGVGHVF